MADIRIKDLATTTTSPAADDYLALDGTTNGTRKMLGTQFVSSQTLTDNAIVRANGTAGQVQNSVLIIADTTGGLSGFTSGSGVTFHGGGSIAGASGAVTITASGTNQDVTLTPSGTGKTVSSNIFETLNSINLGASASEGLFTWDADALIVRGATGNGLKFQVNANAESSIYTSSGNWLMGTATDSSNGRVQLAEHTTAAGGIGLGTDVSVFRAAANVCALGSGDVLQFGAAAAVDAQTDGTHTITVRDSTGTSYKLLAVAA